MPRLRGNRDRRDSRDVHLGTGAYNSARTLGVQKIKLLMRAALAPVR